MAKSKLCPESMSFKVANSPSNESPWNHPTSFVPPETGHKLSREQDTFAEEHQSKKQRVLSRRTRYPAPEWHATSRDDDSPANSTYHDTTTDSHYPWLTSVPRRQRSSYRNSAAATSSSRRRGADREAAKKLLMLGSVASKEQTKARRAPLTMCVECGDHTSTLEHTGQCTLCYTQAHKRLAMDPKLSRNTSPQLSSQARPQVVEYRYQEGGFKEADSNNALHSDSPQHSEALVEFVKELSATLATHADDEQLNLNCINALEDLVRKYKQVSGEIVSKHSMQSRVLDGQDEVMNNDIMSDGAQAAKPGLRRAVSCQLELKVDANTERGLVRCTPGKMGQTKKMRPVELLVLAGILKDGDLVHYRKKSGQIQAYGTIRGTGILCQRCSQIIGCTEFERCAGSALRRPTQNIFDEQGRSIAELMVQAEQLLNGTSQHGEHSPRSGQTSGEN